MSITALRRADRGDLALAAVVVGLAAAAWALTADRMAGMDAGPSVALGGLGWFAVTWLLMMAAMMLPALVPAVIASGRRTGRAGAVALFVAGYLTVWVIVGLLAYAAIAGVRSLHPGFLAWGHAGRWVVAGVIAIAALYQLTPVKHTSLGRCRGHLSTLRHHPGGGMALGAEHGALCVACSWALMAALFALGVMSLTWMAVVAALIALERLAPRPAPLVVALCLLALAIAVAVAPGAVPGFTVPAGHPSAMMQMRP